MMEKIVVENAPGAGQTEAYVICEAKIDYVPDVSVVVCVYNASKYLRQGLDSLLCQSLKTIEVVCIDDNSTDESLDILKEYAEKDNRFSILKNMGNFGAGITRNAGIAVARGKYFLFLDSDDFFEPNMCEKMFQKACKDGSDVVVAGHWFCDAEGLDFKKRTYSRQYLKASPFSPLDFRKKLYSIFQPNAWTKLFKSDLVRQNKVFFENLKSCNDYTFSYTLLAAAQKISLMNDPFVHYRVNTGTNISSSRGTRAISILCAIEGLKRNLERLGLKETYYQAFLKKAVSSFKWELAQCNDSEKEVLIEQVPLLLDKQLYKELGNKLQSPLWRFSKRLKNFFVLFKN